MNKFRYVATLIGAIILMVPAFAMAGMIVASQLHLHIPLPGLIALSAIFALVGWLIARKVGWKNLLGWTLSLIIGGSALAILAFLVGGFNPLLGLVVLAVLAVFVNVFKGGRRYV